MDTHLSPDLPPTEPSAVAEDNLPISAGERCAVTLETQKLEKRHRQIQAQIVLPFSPEQVWQVLIDYEALADFIPNLAKSQRIEHPDSGIRIEQIGVKNALFLKFSARVVLDMVEEFPHTIYFDMVEGDFKFFAGTWILQPATFENAQGTLLTYLLQVCPTRLIPVKAIEQQLGKDLPQNLLAIRKRLYELYCP
ncbi:MAG: cyclase [Acaryochloris sp. SU_5_25]|nr:cyclase [Acaryochloris sp. SU_5_25]